MSQFSRPFRNDKRASQLLARVGGTVRRGHTRAGDGESSREEVRQNTAKHNRSELRSERERADDYNDGEFLPAAGTHAVYRFALWCHEHDVFMHPSIQIRRQSTLFRDYRFYCTSEQFQQHYPLMVIPEKLLIGFKDPSVDQPEMGFRENVDGSDGGLSDESDVCSFFFTALGLLISDLLSALNSARTDHRHFFANSLHRTRTLYNAPYLDNVVFDRNDTCLADVVLQMINNFISSGPLTGKVSRPELCWAISLSLSHSTPMAFASKAPSIGIIPLVHLFPHGGKSTNCVVLANRGDRSAKQMEKYFHCKFSLDFDPKSLFVVPLQKTGLKSGQEVAMQPMAPICNLDLEKDEEVDYMWKLSCGSPPPQKGFETGMLAALQDAVFESITSAKL